MAAITLWDGGSALHDVWATDAGAAEDWTSRHWFARAVPSVDAPPASPLYCGSVFRRDLAAGVGRVNLPRVVADAIGGRAGPRYVLDLYEAVAGDIAYVTSLALDPRLTPAPPSRSGALLSADPMDVIDRADIEYVASVDGGRRPVRVIGVGAGLPPVQPADTAGVVLAPSGGPTIGLMTLRRFGLADGSGALIALGPTVSVGPAPEGEATLEALALATLLIAAPDTASVPRDFAALHRAAPHVAAAALRLGSPLTLDALTALGSEPDPLGVVLEVAGFGRARREAAMTEGAVGVARLMALLDAEGRPFVDGLARAGLELPVRLTGAEAALARAVALAMAQANFPTRLAEAAAHAEREGVAADAERLRAPLARTSGELISFAAAFEIMGMLDAWEAARRRQEAADQRAIERILGRAPPPPDPATDPRAPLDLEALKAEARGMVGRLPDRYIETDKRKALLETIEAYGEDPARWRWAHGALGRLAMAMAAPSAAVLLVERLETWAGLPGFAARMTGIGAGAEAGGGEGVSAVTRLMARLTGFAPADMDLAWAGGDRAPLETLRSALADEIATFGLGGQGAAPGAPAQPSASALIAYGQLLLTHRIARQADELTARVDAALSGHETAGDPALGAVARDRQALGWVRHTLPDGLGRLLTTATKLKETAARAPVTAAAVADFAFDFTPPPGPKTGVPSQPEAVPRPPDALSHAPEATS